MKKIILKPGKQIKEDKIVSTIHVVVPENKKDQERKALKTIYPINSRQNLLEKYSGMRSK